jgi:DNA-3-methyladenine glycosylase
MTRSTDPDEWVPGSAPDTGSVARHLLAGLSTEVAPRLLGARLTSVAGGVEVSARLTEVEAYEGPSDPASHAFRGPTDRNAVMFGPPGFLYVYFVYGMHWCANIVCGPPGRASAVLIRAGEVVTGVDLARRRRPTARSDRELARGPARLAQALGFTGADNGVDLLDPRAPIRLRLADAAPTSWLTGPRVGVSVAREVPLRFWLPDDPTVSVYRPAVRKKRSSGRQT